MGLTFKENCSDIRGSKIIDTIRKLREKKINTSVYDPLVNINELKKLISHFEIKNTQNILSLDATLPIDLLQLQIFTMKHLESLNSC